jgi:phage terminase large subunit-like protein
VHGTGALAHAAGDGGVANRWRRGGKTLSAAKLVVAFAGFCDWVRHLAPGERARILLLGPDREQARIAFDYIVGLLESDPRLARLIAHRTRGKIQLTNRVTIEVATSSFKTVRGYSTAMVVCDEVAFWRSEDSVNPAGEVIAALRPALATLPGSLLLALSTPYAKTRAPRGLHAPLGPGRRRGPGLARAIGTDESHS